MERYVSPGFENRQSDRLDVVVFVNFVRFIVPKSIFSHGKSIVWFIFHEEDSQLRCYHQYAMKSKGNCIFTTLKFQKNLKGS